MRKTGENLNIMNYEQKPCINLYIYKTWKVLIAGCKTQIKIEEYYKIFRKVKLTKFDTLNSVLALKNRSE